MGTIAPFHSYHADRNDARWDIGHIIRSRVTSKSEVRMSPSGTKGASYCVCGSENPLGLHASSDRMERWAPCPIRRPKRTRQQELNSSRELISF